jgi:transmembrane sensor
MGTSTPWEDIQFYLQHRNEPFSSEFKDWLAAQPANQQLWDELSSVYVLAGDVPNFFAPDTQQAWRNIEKRTQMPPRKLPLKLWLVRVAASFLLLVLGASAVLVAQLFNTPPEVFTEVYSPYGHKTMVVLPDSSTVWLNGDTKIRYETTFRKKRQVELSGEALFKVTKDTKKHFTVVSKYLKAEVYGTTFNFKAYPNDTKNEVALVEGSLAVFENDRKLHQLVPNEILTCCTSTNKFRVEKGNMAYITSWSGDELVIDNASFESMVKYLERWYGVEIEVVGTKKITQKISFKLKTESLNELLPVLARIVPMDYDVDGKKVTLKMKR